MKNNSFVYMWNWSKKYILRYKASFLLMILLAVLYIAFTLIHVDFIQTCIDAAIENQWSVFVYTAAGLIAVTVLRVLRNVAFGIISKKTYCKIEKNMKDDFVNAVITLDTSEADESATGELITLQNDDINAAMGFIKNGYMNLLLNPLMSIAGFIYLCYFNWLLAVLVFAPIPVLSVILNHMSNRAGKIHKSGLEVQSAYAEKLYDIYHGDETIKAYNLKNSLLSKMNPLILRMKKNREKYSANGSVTVGFIMAVSYLPTVVALIFGGYLAISGIVSVSLLFGYSQLIDMISTPAIDIYSSMNDLKVSKESMKRLDKVLNAKKERADGEHFTADSNDVVSFENVSFSYNSKDVVLNNICLHVKKGHCAALIGESGAGKSTIINLICGFYPVTAGKIKLFGKDILQWNLETLRQNISYVPQETFLFPTSLSENIRFGKWDATDDEIASALEKAGLTDFVKSLPDGMNTILSEDGSNLSGGQRQRIGLARIFLRSTAKLLIFDEPTASLDPQTEKFILDSIKEFSKDKAVIYISHKTGTYDFCDVIYHLKNGTVYLTQERRPLA